mmetsp:Transcript_41172/g.89725  ORF Transcript_41172/g.89725 Transcript_41172/m.89725 type:complete len:248 (-) Transcript_41172:192-935(-)
MGGRPPYLQSGQSAEEQCRCKPPLGCPGQGQLGAGSTRGAGQPQLVEQRVREFSGNRDLHPTLLVADSDLSHAGPPHSHDAPPRPVVGLLAHHVPEPCTPRHQLGVLGEAQHVDVDVRPVGVGLHDHVHATDPHGPEPPGNDNGGHHHGHQQATQMPTSDLHSLLDRMLLRHIQHPQNGNLIRESHRLYHIGLHQLSRSVTRVLRDGDEMGRVVQHSDGTPAVSRLLVLPSGKMRSSRQRSIAMFVH